MTHANLLTVVMDLKCDVANFGVGKFEFRSNEIKKL